MQHAGVDPQLFTLEITESAAMRDTGTIADTLTRFFLKNFVLSMDDFGTGYSSLLQLYRQPFSELKIDRSFVSEVEHSEEARIIVRSLVKLARNLGLSSCAEGVETASILEYCREVGCDKLQGYGISKPLPADEECAHILPCKDRRTNSIDALSFDSTSGKT